MDHVYIDGIDRAFKKVEISPANEWKSEISKKMNDSLDSGIVKDPNYISAVINNQNFGGCNETESADDLYIVDPTSRTTYIKNKFLGKGGFARVHELMDLTTMNVYAGKIIPKNRITKRQHMEKIAREILIHRGLEHKNVVRLHHFFEDSINAYIILENCSRKSLVHVLKHRQTVTEPEVRYYLKQLVAGVQYIHSRQVIHRDLKPGNMLLTEGMVVKVGDFGLATLASADSRVTICGTPNYIAPEVLNKLSYSYEADIWAIGCIMYALLVGQPPFETATLKETYSRILGNSYSLPSGVSDSARALLSALLRPEPTERPTLAGILESPFFHTGFMPQVLSTLCCYSPPMFPVVNEDITYSGARSAIVVPAAPDLPPVPLLKPSLAAPPTDKPLVALIDRLYPTRTPLAAKGEPPSSPRHSSLKQKLSSVLCSDKMALCRTGKRPSNAAALYQNLAAGFNSMPKPGTGANPPTVECTPLFVSKWIDYSNKYGFGFQLSDKSVGVLFNDNTRIAFTPDRSRVEFHDVHGKVSAHPQHTVPPPLGERLTLLRYFGQYMDKHLTEGAVVRAAGGGPGGAARNKSTVPHMRRWVRTNTAIVMELCSGTLQINFFKDHTKVIISVGKHGYLVTYIDSGRQSCSYWLHDIAGGGCDMSIYDRLRFAAAVLREFIDLEGHGV